MSDAPDPALAFEEPKADRFGVVRGGIKPVKVEDLNPTVISGSVTSASSPEYVSSQTEPTPAPASEETPTPAADVEAFGQPDDSIVEADPEPVTFFAADRYHAMTYVRDHLLDLADCLKAKLHAALLGMDHAGPVSVSIPAPRPPLSTQEAPAGTAVDDDPAAPDDGAFAIRPVNYVAV